MPNNYNDFAAKYRPAIERRLQVALRYEKKHAEPTNQAYIDVLHQLSILMQRGGKRIRPLLFLLTYQGFGGAQQRLAIQAAQSLEWLHLFLLIHDDVIDRDLGRWGGRNITGVYFERFSSKLTPQDAMHLAQAQAVLAGDVCAALATRTLLDVKFDPELINRAVHLVQQMIERAVSGQVAEVQLVADGICPDEAQILQLYRQKTAAYTFGLPLQLGALLSGKPADTLSDIANNLGVAFQLQDDLLNIYGNQQITGKSVLSDIREGKQTLLVRKTLQLAKPSDRKLLLATLGKFDADTAELQAVKAIMTECGAHDYVRTLIKRHTQAALARLDAVDMRPESLAILQDFVRQSVDRKA